jgi:hypothetical protein
MISQCVERSMTNHNMKENYGNICGAMAYDFGFSEQLIHNFNSSSKKTTFLFSVSSIIIILLK